MRRGLSAGRVQSVAVRLVVEREREIKAFVPVEYWTLDAELAGQLPPPFRARLVKVDGEKAEIKDQADCGRARQRSSRAPTYRVAKVDRRERRRNAAAPFITSKLQQEAANRLHFTAKKTMTLAQRLYEGVELGEEGPVGLITYMRTDSVRLSADAVDAVRDLIRDALRRRHSFPTSPTSSRASKNAQDAHEAIRPDLARVPAGAGAALPRAGHVPALRADLEPLPGVPDEARGVRPDHGGHLRRTGVLPGHRLDAEVRRLPRGLRREARRAEEEPPRSRWTGEEAAGVGQRSAAPARGGRRAQA